MKRLKNKRRESKDLRTDTDKVLNELDVALKRAGFDLEMYAVTEDEVKKIDSKREDRKNV